MRADLAEDLLAAWPQIRKAERRMRFTDYAVPLVCLLVMVALGLDGGVSPIDQGLGFALGCGAGATFIGTLHRRRHFAVTRRNVELLSMTIAAYKTAEEEGEGWQCERCNSRHVGDFGGVCQHCGSERGTT
jgi:hypothetical protein